MLNIIMNFTLEQILEAYRISGSMRIAAKFLNISKTTFRNLYYNLQKLCIRCTKDLDKTGLICAKCLEIDRRKVSEKLSKSKICKQCTSEMKRTEIQSNISWAMQKICDSCERQNGLDCLKEHYRKNKPKYLAKNAKRVEYRKTYNKTEKGRASKLANSNKRRAQKAKTQSENISNYIHSLFLNHKFCYYCNSTDNLQVEHLIPLSRGGTHTEDNVTLACKKCNLQKGNKLPNEYQEYLKGV